jgi:beta-lactamase class C
MRAAVVGLLTLFAVSSAQATGSDIRNLIDRHVKPLLQAHDVPGMAVAVTMNGRSEIVTYGVAARDSKTPVTPDTLFELGSVSKAFTGILGGYAVALHRMSLDHHPSRYLPALRGSAVDRATLQQLGTYMAGGLPLQFPSGVTGYDGMTDWLQHWSPSAAPGTQRRYSNPSIGLFGHLAAAALQRDYTTLAEREVFPQLGLRSTYIRVPMGEMARYAWGYNRSNQPVRVSPGPLDAEAYGVKSSAADMSHFVAVNLRPEQLVPPMQRAVRLAQTGHARTGDMIQGLGWEQYPWPVPLETLLAGNSEHMSQRSNAATMLQPSQAPASPARLYNKTGATNGFGAYVVFIPEKNIGLVMLANRNLPIPARVTAAHAVLEQLTRQP